MAGLGEDSEGRDCCEEGEEEEEEEEGWPSKIRGCVDFGLDVHAHAVFASDFVVCSLIDVGF